MTSVNRLNNRPSSRVLFTQKQVKFLRSCTTTHHPSTQEMNASSRISPISLSLSLFPKFLAIREQHSESARPLSTYSLHTLTLALSAGLRRPMKTPRGATRPSERHLHTTQLSLRHRRLHGDARIAAGEAFVSRSLAVLCRRPQ